MMTWDSTTQRVRVPVAQQRRSPWRVVMFTAVFAAVAGGSLYVYQVFTKTDLVTLRTVEVRGTDPTVAREVEAYAALTIGTPLFAVDTDAVAQAVASHPFIESATVRRLPPETVVIEAQVRVAVAAVALSSLYLVDGQGVVFKRAAAGDGLDLPVITGVPEAEMLNVEEGAPLRRALTALTAYQEASAPAGPLASIHIDAVFGTTLFTEGGTEIRLGDTAQSTRLATLANVMTRLAKTKERPALIFLTDARRPERVAVRLASTSEMRSPL